MATRNASQHHAKTRARSVPNDRDELAELKARVEADARTALTWLWAHADKWLLDELRPTAGSA